MDKYRLAIIDYERRRIEIKRLTKAIADAAGGYDEEGPWVNCTDLREGKKLVATTCIDRYWKARNEAASHYEIDCYYGGYIHNCPIEPEEVSLCPSCKEVDRLVQLRKKARQQFGVAKRRISAIAKPLLAEVAKGE